MSRSTAFKGFAVVEIKALELERKSPLAEMYTLSPFVWREGAGAEYNLLVRAVPHSDIPAEKIARVHYGVSSDGLHFKMSDRPAIAPGPGDDDKDGCEDPTLAIVDETYYVYYTGWNETSKRGQLLLASGPAPEKLRKRGVALPWTPEAENPKEATIVQAGDGSWRLFFEYAAGGASKIGIASAPAVGGPWTVHDPLFDTRSDRWDSWHLSTGPVLSCDPQRPIMFYNGATEQVEWRIGWIVFDERFTRVVARCEEPMIAPPPRGTPEDTDIAFAASSVEEGDDIYLYYSIADKDMFRATVRRVG
ncbi:MAG: hypothetical protein GIW99_07470 [Candidatus Eremiobacteraeota bacterium]|nr:hypothetical protein [Candidatus Eremiobacteraeota bacterium]MBC5827503.1 hypothetical protein [Candidatus Eremiobacteraeota bacterium]